MNVDNRSFWSFLKTPNVTVSVRSRREEPCAVFRVKSMIDLGGRQTALLEGYLPEEPRPKSIKKTKLAIPRKIGNLDIVYTTKTITSVSHVYQVIGEILRNSCSDRIVPDVLAPGDYVVFTKREGSKGSLTIDALRVMTGKKAGYAL